MDMYGIGILEDYSFLKFRDFSKNILMEWAKLWDKSLK